MTIIKLEGKSYASNTYLIISANECAVVDPSSDIDSIRDAIGDAKLRYILLTHGHFDHILNLNELRASTAARVYIHRDDRDMPADPYRNASGFFGLDFVSAPPDATLSAGDTLKLGNETIRVISTPGHTPGSICYDCGDALICGDTLFRSGYGRYDLPGGDPHALFASLSMLANLENDPIIYPGHGASCALSDADFIRTLRKNNF